MNSRNLKLALIAAATYLVATLGATGLIAWMRSELSADGTIGFVNAAYITVQAIGLVSTFICGYTYFTRLYQSITRYVQANPDIPRDLVRPICKGRLLSRCYGLVSAVCLISVALIFALSGEAYIETICLLMGIGFIALFFSLNYRFQGRRLYRQRFRLSV